MRDAGRKLLGKYQGTVVSTEDKLRRGRLLVKVSDVLGEEPVFWAEPSTPLAGVGSGMFVRPLPNSKVWVEFQQGDPDSPVWTGFWRGGEEDMPAEALASAPGVPMIVLATSKLNAISMSDAPGPQPGGIVIRHGNAFIAINDHGIQISNGAGATIMLTGPVVDINKGAIKALY